MVSSGTLQRANELLILFEGVRHDVHELVGHLRKLLFNLHQVLPFHLIHVRVKDVVVFLRYFNCFIK